MGYIRGGRFNLLFSAGRPLGGRQLGVDVPATFQPLAVGPIIKAESRSPGYLSTCGVRGTRVRLVPSTPSVPYVPSVESVFYRTSDVRSRMLEPGSSISFRLTEQEGAVSAFAVMKKTPFKKFINQQKHNTVSVLRRPTRTSHSFPFPFPSPLTTHDA